MGFCSNSSPNDGSMLAKRPNGDVMFIDEDIEFVNSQIYHHRRTIISKCSVVMPFAINCVPGIENSRNSPRIKSLLIYDFSAEVPT